MLSYYQGQKVYNYHNLYTTEDIDEPFANLKNRKLYGVFDAMPSSRSILEEPDGKQIMFDMTGFVSRGKLMRLYNGSLLFATFYPGW